MQTVRGVKRNEIIVICWGYVLEKDVDRSESGGYISCYEDQTVLAEPRHLNIEIINAVPQSFHPCKRIRHSVRPLHTLSRTCDDEIRISICERD